MEPKAAGHRLSDLLEARRMTFTQARELVEDRGVEVVNAYNAGYYQAIRDLREIEDEVVPRERV